MVTPQAFVVAAAVLLFSGCAATAKYDCNAPCDTKYVPVCGKDGVTYTNECIAICQNIKIAIEAPCDHDEVGKSAARERKAPPHYREHGAVGKDVLNRFNADGFKFRSFQEFVSCTEGDPNPGIKSNSQSIEPETGNFGALRVSPEGFVYVNTEGSPNAPLSEAPSRSAKAVSGRGSAGRRLHAFENQEFDEQELKEVKKALIGKTGSTNERVLSVFGADARLWKKTTTGYPFKTIGQITLRNEANKELICTAATISRTSVLTAAHCVHSGVGGTYYHNWTFSPGRDATLGVVSDQFGTYTASTMQYVTIPACYLDSTKGESYRESCDFAVITFPKLNGAYLGDLVGYMGLSSNCARRNLTTTGYPADKSFGTMWYQKPCANVKRSCDTSSISYVQMSHNCDTYGGQSGSPVYSYTGAKNGYQIFGVHNYGSASGTNVADSAFWKYPNSATAITPTRYNAIVSWSQLFV